MTDEEKKKYHREYQRKWRLENSDKARATEKKSRERNRDYRLAYAREYNKKYWQENKDKLSGRSREYYAQHSDHIKEQVAVYKAEHPKEVELNRKSRRARLFQWWYGTVLPAIQCSVCGFNESSCMEFHHPILRRPYKHKAIRSMLNGLSSQEAIEAEMKLCVVLCSNCHSIEHARLRREARGGRDF